MDKIINNFSLYRKPIKFNKYPLKDISLNEFIDMLKSNEYKEVTDKCKELKTQGENKELRNHKAKTLDYVTFAGTFSERENASLIQQSGLFAADVDDIENYQEIREALKKDQYTLLLFESPSGGLKAVIKIPMDKDNFDCYVEGYYQYLNNKFDVKGKVDTKCKDISRACFCSYDPDCFYNKDAKVWDTKEHKTDNNNQRKQALNLAENSFPIEVAFNANENYQIYTESHLMDMLKYVPVRNEGKGLGNHSFTIMMALIHYSKYRKKDYFPVFRWWCEHFNSGSTVEQLWTKWTEWFDKPQTAKTITIKSLVHEAYQNGYKEVEHKLVEPKKNKKPQTEGIDYDDVLSQCQEFVLDMKYIAEPSGIMHKLSSEGYYQEVSEIMIHQDMISYFGPWAALKSSLLLPYLRGIKACALDRGQKIIVNIPKNKVCFAGKLYDLKSGSVEEVGSYFVTNAIPWEPKEGEFPTIKNYFADWCGQNKVNLLLDLAAYCCLIDNPEKLIIFLYGPANSGKSQYSRLLSKFLGYQNTHSTRFELLTDKSQRFETYNLRHKLLIVSSEVQGKQMYNTGFLKQISGGDMLRGEKKGVQETVNFPCGGKMLIPTNSIPSLSDSEDVAFKGRCYIIDFFNCFERSATNIIEQIPDQEFEALAHSCLEIVRCWIKNNKINIRGLTLWDDRVKEYENRSDPLKLYIKHHCEFDPAGCEFSTYQIGIFDLLNAYNDWRNGRGLPSVHDFAFGRDFMGKFREKIKKVYLRIDGDRVYTYQGIKFISFGLSGSNGSSISIPYKDRNIELKVLEPLRPPKPTYDEDSITQISSEDLLYFIEEAGEYDTIKFIEKYGQDKLDHLLKTGQVIEIKSGMLKVVD